MEDDYYAMQRSSLRLRVDPLFVSPIRRDLQVTGILTGARCACHQTKDQIATLHRSLSRSLFPIARRYSRPPAITTISKSSTGTLSSRKYAVTPWPRSRPPFELFCETGNVLTRIGSIDPVSPGLSPCRGRRRMRVAGATICSESPRDSYCRGLASITSRGARISFVTLSGVNAWPLRVDVATAEARRPKGPCTINMYSTCPKYRLPAVVTPLKANQSFVDRPT